jgi:RNA polymerase sigma-70 factor (ECF subfamily)
LRIESSQQSAIRNPQSAMSSADADRLLVHRIRTGEDNAWDELISRYEGRLLAFVESRIGRRNSAEDIVQETFIGFLNSLPNFDGKRPLESYLFSICAYKLTDHLRREGRRPTVPLAGSGSSDNSSGGSGPWNVEDSARGASSIARSGERRGMEEKALLEALRDQLARWREKGEWQKLMTCELLFVRGWANKEAAEHLSLSEQHVANYKFEFIAKMKTAIKRQQLSEDVFPELSD